MIAEDPTVRSHADPLFGPPMLHICHVTENIPSLFKSVVLSAFSSCNCYCFQSGSHCFAFVLQFCFCSALSAPSFLPYPVNFAPFIWMYLWIFWQILSWLITFIPGLVWLRGQLWSLTLEKSDNGTISCVCWTCFIVEASDLLGQSPAFVWPIQHRNFIQGARDLNHKYTTANTTEIKTSRSIHLLMFLYISYHS